ncbi:TetR/AcrR family transcriptional regulator [Streptomyces hesseae]|uniref:TetR/AcrR family transcriptional regulator n=1 Tax=Streptomyces hesseae TaxID=3075519 RepID=A0ABU2SJV2_9ACTN|nr:TetR/AcrR family transcriptional regulator [Streptomyces sp. DSM 40473]MDT0449258.1 TetR/AcrR family transcriptional regulator [Streptomyces sp. DSM 40473]
MARPRKFDENRVISAVMDTFWRHGYEATSTRDLSESTGLGPSSLYNSFGDKHTLYLRALAFYYERSTTRQVELLRGPGPAKERLRALMVQAIDLDLAPEGGDPDGCFALHAAMERASCDDAVRDEVRRTFATVEDALCATVAEGQAAGEIGSGRDARSLARHVLSTYYGLRVLSRVRDDREALLDVVDSTLAGL